ncbi:MAG: hypothetical protein ACRDH2_15280 [Anaerolineales bacterium]
MSETAPRSIAALNRLPPEEKERRYAEAIPPALLRRFQIDPHSLADAEGRKLLTITAPDGTSSVELDLRHAFGARDPLFYGHLTDTLNGQILVLLVTVNDPEGPRFDVDRLPDGTKTQFGTFKRNVEAEVAAMRAGLAPSQIRRGLRLLSEFIATFEHFIARLGHPIYFIEPLAYHNAVVFERYGFAYQQGRRWMESLNTRFSPGGDLLARLDGSTPFRQPGAENSIRGRSWAIHDGLLGEPYTEVHMYKHVGKHAGVTTAPFQLRY